MIGALEGEMRKVADKMDFEKAAGTAQHDRGPAQHNKPTRPLHERLPAEHDSIRIADVQALADALQLTRLPAVMECFDISNISTTHVVASMVCFRNAFRTRIVIVDIGVRTVAGQDDFASMAEVVRRRYSRVLLEAREGESRCGRFSRRRIRSRPSSASGKL